MQKPEGGKGTIKKSISYGLSAKFASWVNFDPKFYLLANPDVARAGVNPLWHYLLRGRKEGRIGSVPRSALQERIVAEFDSARENILLVSHEASRTGAPILSLNLVHLLVKRYNVLVLILGSGALISAFRTEGAVVLEQSEMRNNAALTKVFFESLVKDCKFKFALVNSVESHVVLSALARHYIPSISLLHEFAANTRPRDAFLHALLWAGESVFSTNLTLENALSQYPCLDKRFVHVLPQGRCLMPQEINGTNVRSEKAYPAMRPHVADDQPFIVLGAGLVQLRKGVDLFIDCAAKLLQLHPKRRIRFVWVGKGYDPDLDPNYSAYLADQVDRSGLLHHIAFIGEQPNMDEVYEAADLLLLTSRLDPLPNVAIDALSEGLPVLCFEKTTGVADILVEGGLKEDCVAGYLDTQALAERILRLANDTARYRDVATRCKQIALKVFDMERYVRQLEGLVDAASKQAKQEVRDVEEIIYANLLEQDFCVFPQNRGQSLDDVVRTYVRSWATGVVRRKPLAGFHPGIYYERHGVRVEGSDPFADYLRAGSPAGPWSHPVIRNTDESEAVIGKPRIALHLHVFYPELLPEMLVRLAQNVNCPDLFVSVPCAMSAAEVECHLKSYAGRVVAVEALPNRGRDIGPFLTGFGPRIAGNYDFVGHLHTKKTADIKDSSIGATWYHFLLENLLGGESGAMMDRIFGFMSNKPEVGLVFPDDPNVIGWTANQSFASALAERLGIKELPEHFVFPVGTMFWGRVDALKRFWALGVAWDEYPDEPLPYDGSMLHALERLFPLGLEEGYECALTNVAGLTR